jgi:hypothetical protein
MVNLLASDYKIKAEDSEGCNALTTKKASLFEKRPREPFSTSHFSDPKCVAPGYSQA